MSAASFALVLSLSVSFALPYHHHLKEEDEEEEEDEAGMMAGRRGDDLWLLFAGDVVARCGDCIAQKWTRCPPVPLPER